MSDFLAVTSFSSATKTSPASIELSDTLMTSAMSGPPLAKPPVAKALPWIPNAAVGAVADIINIKDELP